MDMMRSEVIVVVYRLHFLCTYWSKALLMTNVILHDYTPWSLSAMLPREEAIVVLVCDSLVAPKERLAGCKNGNRRPRG